MQFKVQMQCIQCNLQQSGRVHSKARSALTTAPKRYDAMQYDKLHCAPKEEDQSTPTLSSDKLIILTVVVRFQYFFTPLLRNEHAIDRRFNFQPRLFSARALHWETLRHRIVSEKLLFRVVKSSHLEQSFEPHDHGSPGIIAEGLEKVMSCSRRVSRTREF